MTHEKWKIVHELSNYTRQPKSLLQQHRRDSWQAPSMGCAPGSGCREELCGLDPRLSELGVRPRGEQEQPQKEDQQLDPACGCRRGGGRRRDSCVPSTPAPQNATVAFAACLGKKQRHLGVIFSIAEK